MPETASVALRAVSFVLLLQAAGTAIFVAVFGRLLSTTMAFSRRLGKVLALTAMVFVAGHYLLEAARMAGDMSGVLDPAMQMMAMKSPVGASFALRMLGLALVAVGLGGRTTLHSRALSALALTGALLAICAFSLTGHTLDHPYRPVLAAILIVHLLLVAFWIGALWPLYVVSSRESADVAGRVVAAFSQVAVWLVPCIALAGIGLAAFLLPDLATFSRPYGQLLLVKIVGFALLMALAALNKWTFGPAIGRADVARSFRRAVVCEYILLLVVLTATAVMTTFYSPEVA